MRRLREVAALVVAQGEIAVNHAVVPPGRTHVVYVDCKSKYVACLGWGSDGDDIPTVYLEATERTIKTVEPEHPDQLLTVVAFPEYRFMRIQAVDCGRYTVTVCFLDDRPWYIRLRDYFKR